MSEKLRKFIALVDEKGRDDFGYSGLTFEVINLVKGQVYTQADPVRYGKDTSKPLNFFVDNNGCSRNIEKCLKEGIIEEL